MKTTLFLLYGAFGPRNHDKAYIHPADAENKQPPEAAAKGKNLYGRCYG